MQPGKSSAPAAGGPGAKKRRRLGTGVKVAIAIAIIAVVLISGLWGMWGGTSFLTVNDVTANEGKYLNTQLEVRGTVKLQSHDLTNKTFILSGNSKELKVNYTGAPPSNFEEGKDVVVKGTLRSSGGLVLVAKEIVVGCASKY